MIGYKLGSSQIQFEVVAKFPHEISSTYDYHIYTKVKRRFLLKFDHTGLPIVLVMCK